MPLGMSGHMCTHTVCAPLAASSVGREIGAACPARSTFPHLFSFLAWLWQRTSCLGFAASSHLPALAACAESCPRAPLLVETHAAVPAPGATSVTVRPSCWLSSALWSQILSFPISPHSNSTAVSMPASPQALFCTEL